MVLRKNLSCTQMVPIPQLYILLVQKKGGKFQVFQKLEIEPIIANCLLKTHLYDSVSRALDVVLEGS